MVRIRVMLVAAVAMTVLAGCTVLPASSPSPSPTATHSATAVAKPLGCDDLADRSELATALDGAATPRDPIVAAVTVTGSPVADAAAIEAGGGLSCDWLGAAGSIGTPDLSLALEPDPDSHWNPLLFADGPESAKETFGSHTVTAAFGDPGYGVTARINGVWLFLELNEPVLETATDGADFDRVLDHARPTITSILDHLSEASPAQLTWPAASRRAGGVTADTCRQFLKPELLDAVIGRNLPYRAPRALDTTSGIADLAMTRAGYPDCLVLDGFAEIADFQVATGARTRLDGLRTGVEVPNGLSFAPTTLCGLPSREWAIASHSGDVVFTLGDDVVEVTSAPDATKLAEAIVGQAY